MPAAIWKGNVTFGLVNIPVTLRSAEEHDEIDFTLLDKRDLSPIGYKKYNKRTGREVAPALIVRGVEYAEGRYVIVTDEDIRHAAPERSQTIEILSFVDRDAIPPSYFDRPYLLEPAPKSMKPYVLLREALERTGKVGVSKVVIRTREYLAAVIPGDQMLFLNLLRFEHELADIRAAKAPGGGAKATGVSEKEVKMASRLVEEMVEPWNPAQYHDEYRDELLAFVKRKAKTGKAEAVSAGAKPAAKRGAVIDMMSLLQQSLEKSRKTSAGKGKRRASPAARRSRSAPRQKRAARGRKSA